MVTLNVSKQFEWHGKLTRKSTAAMRMFGLTVDSLRERQLKADCKLLVRDGDVVYLTGPSGSGKSVLLRELEQSIPACERINLSEIELPEDKTVIDCVDADFMTTLRLLSVAGLNDCLCLLNCPAQLSDGQKYRFKLAAAMASGKKYIFGDEFCSKLDRVTAAVISYNLQRQAKKSGCVFLLASSHEDMLIDLEPDVLVTRELSGETEVIYRDYDRCGAGQ